MTLKLKEFIDKPFKDKRGVYWTSWQSSYLKGIKFVHDKFSVSKYRVLRGLHGDSKTWKLISCSFGKFYFVVVNYDQHSKNYLKKYSTILNYDSGKQILVPPKHLNGMMCLSEQCVVHYKLSYKGRYVDSKDQISVKWNDNKFKIKWPLKNPILSNRDK